MEERCRRSQVQQHQPVNHGGYIGTGYWPGNIAKEMHPDVTSDLQMHDGNSDYLTCSVGHMQK